MLFKAQEILNITKENYSTTNFTVHLFFFFFKGTYSPLQTFGLPSWASQSTYRDILVGLLGWGISPMQGLY
jgi:hypothetical protein